MYNKMQGKRKYLLNAMLVGKYFIAKNKGCIPGSLKLITALLLPLKQKCYSHINTQVWNVRGTEKRKES